MATHSVIEVGPHCCGFIELFGVLHGSVALVTASPVGMVACSKFPPPEFTPLLQIDVSIELISGVELN